MTAIVRIEATDRPVTILRLEKAGGNVTLAPGQHGTFTLRPHEAIMLADGDGLAAPLHHEQEAQASEHAAKPPSQVG